MPRTQWHPLFAELLRPLVEEYYSVETNVSVGDLPREADIVLVRRTTPTLPPFQGVWRHLTAWNVIEFKGPSVSPRRRDLLQLVEVGLGIHRRYDEQRLRQEQSRIPTAQVSFWYAVKRFGSRFLKLATDLLGPTEPILPGLWRCRILGFVLFLVAGEELPVDRDSIPLHLIGREPPEKELAVARLILTNQSLHQLYGEQLIYRYLRPEGTQMDDKFTMKLKEAIPIFVKQLGWEQTLEQLGRKEILDAIGLETVIKECGARNIVKHIGLDQFLTNLSPEERSALKQKLLESPEN